MKKELILILIAFCTLSAFSQTYKPFITPGKQFSIKQTGPMDPTYVQFHHFYFLGDTVINGKNYRPLYIKGYWTSNGNPPTNFNGLHSFLREDILEQKVYEIHLGPSSGNTEYLKWDFSASIGDTVYQDPNGNNDFIIDQITALIINNGDTVREFYGKPSGIGTSRSLYTEMVYDGQFGFDMQPQGLCNYQDAQTVLYSRGNICNSNNYISIEENKSSISLFPNPVSGYLNIYLENKAEVEVYNSNGQMVIKTSCYPGENLVDFSNQTTGIFYLVLKYEDKLAVRKIIKD